MTRFFIGILISLLFQAAIAEKYKLEDIKPGEIFYITDYSNETYLELRAPNRPGEGYLVTGFSARSSNTWTSDRWTQLNAGPSITDIKVRYSKSYPLLLQVRFPGLPSTAEFDLANLNGLNINRYTPDIQEKIASRRRIVEPPIFDKVKTSEMKVFEVDINVDLRHKPIRIVNPPFEIYRVRYGVNNGKPYLLDVWSIGNRDAEIKKYPYGDTDRYQSPPLSSFNLDFKAYENGFSVTTSKDTFLKSEIFVSINGDGSPNLDKRPMVFPVRYENAPSFAADIVNVKEVDPASVSNKYAFTGDRRSPFIVVDIVEPTACVKFYSN